MRCSCCAADTRSSRRLPRSFATRPPRAPHEPPARGGPAQRDASAQHVAQRPVVVASKPFAESYVLAEMFAQLLESRGVPVIRHPGLGATEVAFAALRAGSIDVYPEYTGTGLLAILGHAPVHDADSAF